jgi:hypothetical protein
LRKTEIRHFSVHLVHGSTLCFNLVNLQEKASSFLYRKHSSQTKEKFIPFNQSFSFFPSHHEITQKNEVLENTTSTTALLMKKKINFESV